MMKKQSSPSPKRKKGRKRDTSAEHPVAIYGAQVILAHLEAFQAEVAGVHAGEEDIEFIHRARVASRRLRAALPMFGEYYPSKQVRRWLKGIREVTRALGAARDLDVQIERVEKALAKQKGAENQPGLERLRVRLGQQREAVQPGVVEAMRHLLESDLLAEMSATLRPYADRAGAVYIYTGDLYRHAEAAIRPRLEAFLAYEPILHQPEKVTELHEMRIAAKWLRYTLEAFARLYPEGLKTYLQATRKVQELLGDIHDCDVWAEFLPGFCEAERARVAAFYGSEGPFERLAPGLRFFEANRQQAREATYQELLSSWADWKQEKTWDRLGQAIEPPFRGAAPFYPPLNP